MSLTRFLVVAFMLAFAPAHAADPAPTLEQIEASGKIRIGYRESLPPMSYLDDRGAPTGYSIELCSLIVEEVRSVLGNPDLEAEFVMVDADNRFPALEEGRIDILCGATTKTLARMERVDFTQLTFVTGAGFLSSKSNPVETVPDLRGQKIAVVGGTTTEAALKGVLEQTATEADIVNVESGVEAMALLESGEVAAYTADQIVLIGTLVTHPDPGGFLVGGNLYSFEPLALALRRNDADFRLVADRVLSRLYRDGGIVDIYTRWFGRISDKVPGAIAAAYELNATPE